MFQAQELWSYRYGQFAERFRYQYVISRSTEAIEGFEESTIGDLKLYTGRDLPLRELRDAAGSKIGYVLGIAVGMDALETPETLKLPFRKTTKSFWTRFETWLNDAAGRYAFVVDASGGPRLYTDPVGMIGAVYNSEDGYAASSTMLAIKRPLRPHPKYDFDVIRDLGGRLTLFHTADKDVHRLNPNHYTVPTPKPEISRE
jgi:hypothetical protein